MANYATLKAAIADVVKTNGNQAITGANLQAVLLSIVNTIGAKYTFTGVATPSTDPGDPDQNVFYIGAAGTYANFGTSVTIPEGSIGVFMYNGSWTKSQVKLFDVAVASDFDNPDATKRAKIPTVGAIFDGFVGDGVYDVSARNGGATFASLEALLSNENLATLIPTQYRHGGMEMRFVLTYDNTYVQYMYMGTEVTGSPNPFLNVANWQGVDAEPEAGSRNLAESRGILKQSMLLGSYSVPLKDLPSFAGVLISTGLWHMSGTHSVISVSSGQIISIKRGVDNIYVALVKSYVFPVTGETPDYATGESVRAINSATTTFTFIVPSDAKYLIITRLQGGIDRSPSILKVNNYDVLNGCVGNINSLHDNITEGLKKKVDVKYGKNLWDITPVSGKYLKSDGTLASGSSYSYTENYIPLLPNTEYSLTDANNEAISTSSSTYFCFYNSNKQLLANSALVATTKTFTTPSGCAYGRFSFISTGLQIQLETGEGRTSYKPATPIGGYYVEHIADGAVNANTIADGQVIPQKTSFMVLGKNLFDYRTMTVYGKYIKSSGAEATPTNPAIYACSDYIQIEPEMQNIVSNVYGYSGSYNAFYDSNKNFISGSSFQVSTSAIPQNAAYVRFSFPDTGTEEAVKTIQVEYGAESTSFEEYGYKMQEKYMPSQQDENLNKIVSPKYWYLLSGVNNDIFYEPILEKWNPYRYDVKVTTIGTSLDYVKAIKRVATFNNPTATGVSLSVWDNDKEAFIHTKSVTFRKGTQGVGSSTIKVGIIGDSYTDGGCFNAALLANGYVPNIELVGTKACINYPTQYTDGRSGFSLENFFSIRLDLNEFSPFYHPQGSHRYWGTTTFWKAVSAQNPSESAARYSKYNNLCDSTTGFPLNPENGDVIYDNASTSFKEYQSGNWSNVQQSDYAWEFNYGKYLTMWNIDAPDILCVMLGVNDFWMNKPTTASLAVWKERMNTIKTSFFTSNPSGKFVILTANTVTHPNTKKYQPLNVHYNMQILRKFVIEEWDNKEAENIYIVDTAQLIDSENSFTLVESVPFDGYPRNYGYTNKEIYTADGQHPRVSYTTLGYSLAAFIQYIR